MSKAIQHQFATEGKCRTYVNALVDIIRRCFKWAVNEELVPASVYHALQTKCDLFIDDEFAATVNGAELAKGWNMASAKGPITAQSMQVMQLVMRKNAAFFRRWKEIQLTPSRHNELPGADKRLAELETEIEQARRTRPHSFALRPRE